MCIMIWTSLAVGTYNIVFVTVAYYCPHLGDTANSLGPPLPEHHLGSSSEVLGVLDEAEAAASPVPCPQVVPVHVRDGGCLACAGAVHCVCVCVCTCMCVWGGGGGEGGSVMLVSTKLLTENHTCVNMVGTLQLEHMYVDYTGRNC